MKTNITLPNQLPFELEVSEKEAEWLNKSGNFILDQCKDTTNFLPHLIPPSGVLTAVTLIKRQNYKVSIPTCIEIIKLHILVNSFNMN